jgi:hypothetical protein
MAESAARFKRRAAERRRGGIGRLAALELWAWINYGRAAGPARCRVPQNNCSRVHRLQAAMAALSLIVGLGVLAPSVADAASSGKSTTKQSSKTTTKKSTTTSKPSASKSGKSAKAPAKSKVCYETVKRNGKSVKVKKPCGEPAESVVTKSPINARSLENSGTPLEGSPVKARSAPVRAYAVDGSTFFHNGRKIVVDGLGPETSAGLTHDHAAQRLQRLLDGGTVSIDPVAADESGAVRARVRVDGRDVADLMRTKP